MLSFLSLTAAVALGTIIAQFTLGFIAYSLKVAENRKLNEAIQELKTKIEQAAAQEQQGHPSEEEEDVINFLGLD